jgi:hypothetical protein
MNTTRFDHTECLHPSTPAGRRFCREDRKMAIKGLQAAYTEMEMSDDTELRREYEARVDIFSQNWGMDLHAAYNLIENGPVIH